jgi:hypothetical protein
LGPSPLYRAPYRGRSRLFRDAALAAFSLCPHAVLAAQRDDGSRPLREGWPARAAVKEGPGTGRAGPTEVSRGRENPVRLGADWTAATSDALTDVKTCQQKPGGHAGQRAKRINVGPERVRKGPENPRHQHET